VIAARHLNWKNNLKRAYVSPYVEIEVIGHHLDTVNSKQTTKTIGNNLRVMNKRGLLAALGGS